MARTFRRRHVTHPVSELNVTNLVDLAFTLLIVFMLAAPLIQPEQKISVNLPVESVRPQQKQDPLERTETITVRSDGQISLGTQMMSLNELIVQLQRFGAETKPPVIALRLDAGATAQQFTSVMEAMSKNNLTKFYVATQPQSTR